MKTWLIGAVIAVCAASFTLDAEAQRRLGGARTFGKPSQNLQQRQQAPQQAAPSQQQAPQSATPNRAGAPAAAPASPMRGMLMGLAAGLGLAALASWLGLGEAFAMFLLFALVGLIAFAVIGMLMRRSQQARPAYPAGSNVPPPTWQGAGGPSFNPAPRDNDLKTMQRAMVTPMGSARSGSVLDEFSRKTPSLDEPWGIPADFDADAFLAQARSQYARLQRAWDTGALDELQEFTTQEMFTALTHELRSRSDTQTTEIVALDAKLLGIEHSPQEYLASVRFTGSLRINGETEAVDEVWNLTKPAQGKGGWLLAGIQQLN